MVTVEPAVAPTVHTIVLGMQLTERIQRWAHRYGDKFDNQRFRLTCLTMALAAPVAPPAALELVARQALLLWAIDDELEPVASAEAYLPRMAHLRDVLDGKPGTDDITVALAELRHDLSGYPLFAELGGHWVSSMAAGFTGAYDEWTMVRSIAAGSARPSAADYLRAATASILKRPMLLAMLMVTETDSLTRHWPHLDAALDEANVAVRLANDYASYNREKNTADLNIMMFGVTREQVRSEISNSMRRIAGQLQPLRSGGEPISAAVTVDRYTSTAVEFYLSTDYKDQT